MAASNPAEICQLFQQCMRQGDIESVLTLYDRNVVFMNQAGEEKRGADALRYELAPLADKRASFDFSIKKIIQTGEIALMHTLWNISAPEQMSLYAIEVARRQSDGTWRWLIGDPFTIGRQLSSNLDET